MNTKWISESSLMTTLRQREESMKVELMKLKKEKKELINLNEGLCEQIKMLEGTIDDLANKSVKLINKLREVKTN